MASNLVPLSPMVTCEVCSEFFSDPRMLPCLHSFCYKCLLKTFETKECKEHACPSCNEIFVLPDGGLEVLPKDLRKIYEAEVAKYEDKIGSHSGASCDRCIASSESVAITFCCNCCKFLCSRCKEDHVRWRETYEHELIDVGMGKENSQEKSLLGSVPHKINHCQVHSDEVLKFYCETCSQLICRDCIILSHNEHKYNRVEQVAEKEKSELKSLLVKTDSAAEQLESSVCQGEKVVQKIEEKRSFIDQKIKDEFKNLYEALRVREKFLLAKNSEISLEKQTALKLQQEPMTAMKKEIEQMAVKIREAIHLYTPAEILSVKRAMMTKLESFLKQFDSLSHEPCKTESTTTSFINTSLLAEIERFGVVTGGCYAGSSTATLYMLEAIEGKERQIQVTARDIHGKPFERGGEQVVARFSLLGSNEYINGKVKDKGDGTYIVSITPQSIGEHSLDIKIGNESIQSSPFVISVRKQRVYTSLSVLQTYSTPSYPHDVAASGNKVFITQSGCNYINVVDKVTSQVSQIPFSGSGVGSSIFGIAVLEDTIYIVDQGNHCIHKLTTTGKLLSTFGSSGSGNGQLSSPNGLVISLDGKVYVSEQGNSRISVFSADGTFEYHITGNMNYPWGIAIDPSGNLHVANYNSYNIAVFTPQGKYVTQYGSGQVTLPVGIAIDPEGYIFITEWNSISSQLHVFDYQYRVVNTLLQGTINYGRGVTLDKDGFVYVCDYYNKRVFKI